MNIAGWAMRRVLISVSLLSATYASGPLNNYSFDAVYENEELAIWDYQGYLANLERTMAAGLECQSHEDGSLIGGAFAADKLDKLRNAPMAVYRQLFAELDGITDGFIGKKSQADLANDIQSGDLRTVSRLAAAARYYQKAVAPKDILNLRAQQQTIDLNVAQMLSGREGVSQRQATPAEEERYIRLVYEQAHRGLANQETLEDALRGFTAKNAGHQAHVATLRAIFCMAWLFHQGDEAWQDANALKNMIGAEYFKYINLNTITQKTNIFDIFQDYKRFRDRYVDDQVALSHNTQTPINWGELDQAASQDLAWTIAKVSARYNTETPNANYNDADRGYTARGAWAISQNLLDLSDAATHIEGIAPDLLAYLSQIQRGCLVHIRASKKILQKFAQTPQIYAVLPDFFNSIASRNTVDPQVGFISQSNVKETLSAYSADSDRMESMQQGVVRLLSSTPWALKSMGQTMFTQILDELNKPQSTALKILTKAQYQAILEATFKELSTSLPSLKKNSDLCELFLNILLLSPVKIAELEALALPVSMYHLQSAADFDKCIMQPIIAVCKKYPDVKGVSLYKPLAQLLRGSPDETVMRGIRVKLRL